MTRPWVSRRMKRKAKRRARHFWKVCVPALDRAFVRTTYTEPARIYTYPNGSDIAIGRLDEPARLIGGPNIADEA